MASIAKVVGDWAPLALGRPASSDQSALLTRARPLARRLRDGTPVRLRLLDAGDRERLREGFERLSPQSRYRRFFTPIHHLTEAMLDRLSETDELNHVAVGAERGGLVLGRRQGLGVARFIRLADQPDTAELALAVADELQGRGLGRLLVKTLCKVARDRGVRRFRALVLPENVAMQSLIHELDVDATSAVEDGIRTFTLIVPEIDLDAIGLSSSRGARGPRSRGGRSCRRALEPDARPARCRGVGRHAAPALRSDAFLTRPARGVAPRCEIAGCATACCDVGPNARPSSCAARLPRDRRHP
jgi:GNAT superfamily N-acetyltransferase